MKLLSSIALIFGLVPAKPSPKEKMDVACMMTAISAVENTRYDQIGMAGERSTFQLTRTVWLTHSDLPFEIASQNDAKSLAEVRRVVQAHIAWCRARFPRLHYPNTPYHVFLVYKAGFERCLLNKVRTKDVEYAKRANNVYEEITQ